MGVSFLIKFDLTMEDNIRFTNFENGLGNVAMTTILSKRVQNFKTFFYKMN